MTRRAIYASAMEFWLDRGVDGFRIDTVNTYHKAPGLPDAPVVDLEAAFQPAGLLYCNGPRIHEFLGEMNAILSRYGAITVGELIDTPDVNRVLDYVSATAKQLDMAFQFDAVDVGLGKTHKYKTIPRNFTLPDFKAAIGRTQALIRGTDGWATVFLENYDRARSVSRFADDRPEYRVHGAKLLALMQACLSGTQYIYQGQEIGSVNAPKEMYALEDYLDIDSQLFIKMIKEQHGASNKEECDNALNVLQYLARDHARLPMPWNGKSKYGEFSEAAERAGKEVKRPWMKHHPLASEINVKAQLEDSESVLAFWRRVILLRQDHADQLVYGEFRDLRPQDNNLFVFVKESQLGDKALVMLNFTAEEKAYEMPSAAELGWQQEKVTKPVRIMSTYAGKAKDGVLAPFEGQVFLVSC